MPLAAVGSPTTNELSDGGVWLGGLGPEQTRVGREGEEKHKVVGLPFPTRQQNTSSQSKASWEEEEDGAQTTTKTHRIGGTPGD